MTVGVRRLLSEDRATRQGQHIGRRTRWTDAQRALFDSPHHLTVWWGANGIGKSMALAELTRRGLAGELHWQEPGPQTVILAGNTWKQLGVTLEYLWELVDPSWFRKGVRFESGAMKGQRMPVYDVIGGPGKGGKLWLGTFDAENLAGPRASMVVSDEPLPERPFAELWPRLLGRNGRMYMGFTPTLGTSSKVDHIWSLVDDPDKAWAGQIQTVLTLDAVTPRGGLIEVPWMSEDEITRMEQGVSKIEADMRMGRTRTPRLGAAYFSAWRPELIAPVAPPAGTPLAIGIDHGSRPGAQRATLVAVGGKGLFAHVWVLDEYKGEGRTEVESDAAGILAMLERQGCTIEDVDLWIGDRAHRGDRRGGMKSNDRLKQAIAQHLGLDTTRRGWSEKLPKPLRYMMTPRKYDRSVWEGVEIMHRLMVGDSPRITVAPSCVHLAEDLSTWQGSTMDPAKDGIDSARYVIVPMVEGLRH